MDCPVRRRTCVVLGSQVGPAARSCRAALRPSDFVRVRRPDARRTVHYHRTERAGRVAAPRRAGGGRVVRRSAGRLWHARLLVQRSVNWRRQRQAGRLLSGGSSRRARRPSLGSAAAFFLRRTDSVGRPNRGRLCAAKSGQDVFRLICEVGILCLTGRVSRHCHVAETLRPGRRDSGTRARQCCSCRRGESPCKTQCN